MYLQNKLKQIWLFCKALSSVYIWPISFHVQLQIHSVMWRFQRTKMNVNSHLHFLLKSYLNVTCLVVRVILISKVSIDMWFFLFFHKSHYMSKSKSCVSIDMHFIFVCQMSKTCKNFVQNTQRCLVRHIKTSYILQRQDRPDRPVAWTL
jgi:hypothetical protein